MQKLVKKLRIISNLLTLLRNYSQPTDRKYFALSSPITYRQIFLSNSSDHIIRYCGWESLFISNYSVAYLIGKSDSGCTNNQLIGFKQNESR